VRAAERDRCDDILGAARQNHADRHLPIVRSVGRVRCTRRIIEANLARNRGAERYAESFNRYHSIAILAQRVR